VSDTSRLENRPPDPTSLVCPHCMKDVPLPKHEPHGDAEFRPKLAAFRCPVCTELIRLDN